MPDLVRLFERLRERLGWPLLAVIGAGVLIILLLAFSPGNDTLAAPRPAAPAATKADTPAMGEVAPQAPKKPSPAVPKKTRRR